jgi:hypothetical protein
MASSGPTINEWLSDEDHRLRAALETVNLVVEMNLTADEIRRVQSRYGLAVEAYLKNGHGFATIANRYPALTLAALVGQAALGYDQGAYWREFWDELGVPQDQNRETELRHQIDPLLKKFNLAIFPELQAQHRYVMTLAMHAGIPRNCLRDLLQMIDTHLVQGREPNGTALLEWLEEPGKQYRTTALDVPVRNFIRYGGEFAVDIIDRIIDVVDATVADHELLNSGLDTATTGLPAILLDRLVEELRDNRPEWKGRRASAGTVQRRPELSYSADDDQIFVSLPYPRAQADKPWRVSFDGSIQEVFPQRGWGVADGNHPPTLIAVPAPVREIVLWHEASDSSFTLRVVSPSDPLLVFSADGSWIPRRDALKDAVWVIHPSNTSLHDPEAGCAIPAPTDSGSPAGWRGWSSSFIDLSGVGALQLRRDGEAVGARHIVRTGAPRFELRTMISGCSTAEGRAVYADRPWVILPPSLSEQPTVWRVKARRVGSNEWLCDEGWNAEKTEPSVDPFDDADLGLLGLFEIVVSGPIGSDERIVVFLAEGLSVEFDTELRTPSPGGLTPCVANLESSTALHYSVDQIAFTPDQLETLVEITDGADSEQVVIRPPYIQIRSGVIGQPASWRSTAETCSPEQLLEDRFVAVRLPTEMTAEFIFIDGTGKEIQREKPRLRPGGVQETAAAKFFGSAQSTGIGRIVARISGSSGVVEAPALSVRPPDLCGGISISGGALDFSDLIDSSDLGVHIWRSTAPWLPPLSLPLDGQRLPLSTELVECGELRCQVFIDDPWTTVEAPNRPDAKAIRVAQPGWTTGPNAAQTHLSRFLAGQGPAPESAVNAPEVWSALSWLDAEEWEFNTTATRSALVKMLGRQPRQAIECLGNSTIPMREKMALLIGCELVNRSLSAEFTLNELHADPWFGCMVELSDLPALAVKKTEAALERAETLSYLRDKGGDVLLDVLARGKAARPYEGSFDKGVFMMSAMDPSRVEKILDDLRLVPGALLDVDTRVAGTVEAFRLRDQWVQAGGSDALAVQTSFAMTAIKQTCAAAYDVIGARSDALAGVSVADNPWMLMSLQSLTLAVVARLEAHSRISGQYLSSGSLAAWEKMARLCPRLVATDILLAEALVVYSMNGDLTGDASDDTA